MHWIFNFFRIPERNFLHQFSVIFARYGCLFFPHSPKTKMLWKEQTGRAMPMFSKTRWWSRWEVLHHIMLLFGDVEPFS